ncbi:expressed unknown protein [Seminavis robusta]|uniref:Uncharacterized protein n=1 Tax=Seminavis robusta TaxID=568900 RepID=A0A9N8HD78_9STRA|nr:expressed unknown protein [Seminavis robusta]|eukprot:Sro249_g098550.1 n/a (541) ;mRNA; f:3171-4793
MKDTNQATCNDINNGWDASDEGAATATKTGHHENAAWDDHDGLFHFDLLRSPRREDHGDEDEGNAPIVGEIVDFDGPAMAEATEDNNKRQAANDVVVVVDGSDDDQNNKKEEEDNEEGDNCSDDGSFLKLEMFEGVFEEHPDGSHTDDGIIPLADEDVVGVVSTTATNSSSSDTDSSVKRPAEVEEDDSQRSFKKAKPQTNSTTAMEEAKLPTEIALKLSTKPAPPKVNKPSAAAANLISAFQEELVIKQDFPTPKHPRKRRPNCMFVNHFGTRLNVKTGASEPVNVPSKNRISSCEESISIRTKTTASTRSSKSADTKGTPVCATTTKSGTPSVNTAEDCVPSVVRIVTPTANKPAIRSSRLEDITMEEDELEPIYQPTDDDDVMVIDKNHLPYITSLPQVSSSPRPKTTSKSSNNKGKVTSRSSSPKTPPAKTTTKKNISLPPMVPPVMMSPCNSRMQVNFNRPFPLLQRRAFLAGACPPMPHHAQAAAFAAGAAAAAAGWHGAAFPHPGMPFPPSMSPFPPMPNTPTSHQWTTKKKK